LPSQTHNNLGKKIVLISNASPEKLPSPSKKADPSKSHEALKPYQDIITSKNILSENIEAFSSSMAYQGSSIIDPKD
jgi:capsular polysaccharide biosynthesis protein